MFKIVKKAEATIRKITDNKIAFNYIAKNISKAISLAIVEATDLYEKETTNYNRIYYLTEGKLILKLEKEEINLSEGDACFIDKGTVYEMSGTFKAVVVNQPAFGT